MSGKIPSMSEQLQTHLDMSLPLTVGGIELPGRVLLAPMSGVTDMPFRRIVKKHGEVMVISEMIASQAMVRQVRKAMLKARKHPDEEPVAVQLAGCCPAAMAEAARLNADLGAKIIDINMGCPAKKVVGGYAGSALMQNEKLARSIIEATVKAVNIPVTLKMRTGWDITNRNAPMLARIAEESGIQMITVHGRTRNQFYTGVSDWKFIAEVKNATALPVIVNGDIKNFDDAAQALSDSHADGVMIGRGCYGKPWLPADINHFLKTGERRAPPPLLSQKESLLQQIEMMHDLYGTEVALKMARKHISWYCKGLPDAAAFRATVNVEGDPAEVVNKINVFYDRCQDFPEAQDLLNA